MIFNKKSFVTSALLALLLGTNSLAAVRSAKNSYRGLPERTMRIATGITSAGFPLSFDIAVADRVSLGVFGAYFNLNDLYKGVHAYNGGTVGLGAKFHLSDRAFNDGWFIKPDVYGEFSLIEMGRSKGNMVALAPNVTAGYDWVWESGFSLGLGLGPAYKHFFTNDKVNVKALPDKMKGFMGRLDFTLGWVF